MAGRDRCIAESDFKPVIVCGLWESHHGKGNVADHPFVPPVHRDPVDLATEVAEASVIYLKALETLERLGPDGPVSPDHVAFAFLEWRRLSVAFASSGTSESEGGGQTSPHHGGEGDTSSPSGVRA
jgi:hypothetical protein